jgi:hypothetical protein
LLVAVEAQQQVSRSIWIPWCATVCPASTSLTRTHGFTGE